MRPPRVRRQTAATRIGAQRANGTIWTFAGVSWAHGYRQRRPLLAGASLPPLLASASKERWRTGVDTMAARHSPAGRPTSGNMSWRGRRTGQCPQLHMWSLSFHVIRLPHHSPINQRRLGMFTDSKGKKKKAYMFS